MQNKNCHQCGNTFKPHDKNRKFCSKQCYYNSLVCTKEEFILKAKKIHGEKFDYSKIDYQHSEIKTTFICNQCNSEFLSTPTNHHFIDLDPSYHAIIAMPLLRGMKCIFHGNVIRTVNIAGNSEQTSPGIEKIVYEFLVDLFAQVKEIK